MKKAVVSFVLLFCILLSGCSFYSFDRNNAQQQETVFDKETVYISDIPEEILKKAEESADHQYWIVFNDVVGKLTMSTFDAFDGFRVTWRSDGRLVCDNMVGVSISKEWSSKKNTFTGEDKRKKYINYHATEIVGSNCDIYDEKNDKIIKANAK